MAKGKAYLKLVRTDSVALVDEDGVMETVQKPTFVKVPGDTAYTQWLDNLSPVIKLLKHVADIKLLYWIGKNLEYDGGIICLNKVYKTQCSKEMNISMSAIDKSIKVLKNKKIDILIAHENSKKSAIFRVNPAYLWRGRSAARDKNETQWLERERINNLPDKEKEQQIYLKTKPRKRFDFKGVKPDPSKYF